MDKRHDAMELAEGNRTRLGEDYTAASLRIQEAGKSAELNAFLKQVEGWTVSMNMRSVDLKSYLVIGRHRNIFHKSTDARAAFISLGGDLAEIPSLDESMALNDGKWHPKRKAYRDAILNEENFKYGAFFHSGEGLPRYGDYTVLLRREVAMTYLRMIALKSDSLEYVDEKNVFDLERFKCDIACTDNAVELAALKHEEHLMQGCEHASNNLCYFNSEADRSYLEIQIEDDVTASHISEIKLTQKHKLEIMHTAKKQLKGQNALGSLENLTELKNYKELTAWNDFLLLSELSRNLGIKMHLGSA